MARFLLLREVPGQAELRSGQKEQSGLKRWHAVALVGTLLFSDCLNVVAAGRARGQEEQAEEDLASSGPPDFYAPEEELQSYINDALDKNPAVREMLARYGAALERAPQVSTLPDPVFSFTQAIRTVETRVGPQLNSYVLSQAFPWFGTLDLRGKVAMQEALSVFERYRATQQEIVVQVKRAFYDLAYVDAALGITREEQSLLEHYEELAQTRYATGQGLQQAVIKIQAEITRVLNRLDILAQQRTSLEARLNTLMDCPPQSPLPLVSALTLPEASLDINDLDEPLQAGVPEPPGAQGRGAAHRGKREGYRLSEERQLARFLRRRRVRQRREQERSGGCRAPTARQREKCCEYLRGDHDTDLA